MPFLQVCLLGCNRLSSLPIVLASRAPMLWRLDLSHNMLSEIGPCVKEFGALEELVLDANLVTRVSADIYQAPMLRRASLRDNPLTNPTMQPSISALPNKPRGSVSQLMFIF